MANVLAGVRSLCRQRLQDELPTNTGNLEYTDEELDTHILNAVSTLSLFSPVESKETLTATDSTGVLSTSGITGLLSVEYVEYPTGYTPVELHACSVFGTDLTIDAASLPVSGDTVYAYCKVKHTLTETSTTLNAIQEQAVIHGACGAAAMSKSLQHVNRVSIGGASVQNVLYTWGSREDAMFRAMLAGLRKHRTTRVLPR